MVGGGIGGFTTALALALRGMEVQVLERAPEFTEIGAGLQFGPNANRALERLGVLDAVLKTAVLPTKFAIMDVYTGAELYHAKLGEVLASRYGAPYTVMHRHDLLTALMEGARATGRVEALPGKEVVDLAQDSTGVRVTCADGSTYQGDVLVGADGVRSIVRRLVLDDSEPLMSEYVIYRGPGPRPEGIEDAVMLYTGDQMHLMQYPIQGGAMVNRVLSFRSTKGKPGSDEWGTPEELFDRFSVACDHVRAALPTLDLEKKWVQFDRAPLAGWAQGRVALLGDAAHAMRQYLAQGAGQAVEDALALAEALSARPDDIPAALARYEEVRFPRASAVQMNTRFFGEFTHFGGIEALVRNYLLKILSSDDYELVEWLYGDGSVPPPVPPRSLNLY